MPAPDLRRLTPAHAAEYRALMLRAYADEPEAFTATVAERAPLPLAWWAARLADDPGAAALVFGAFEDGALAGAAGLAFERRERTRHRATLVGLYVRPESRRRGLARALVEAVVAHAGATPGTCVLQLKATETNAAALRLYAACGFVPYGTEPFANRVGARFVSVVHLWRSVGPPA